MFTATGKYAVCCKYKYALSTNGVELNVAQHSLEEAWASDTLKQVRHSFTSGIMPEGCEKCRLEELSGIQSTRQHSFDYAVSDAQIEDAVKPTRIEIYPGNLCNLKCRICFATNSTKWIQEAKDEFDYDAKEYFLLTPKNMQAIERCLPHITELTFAGGEPFLYDETEELLDSCIQSGRAGYISLLINTNATIYKQNLIDKLKQFKRVVLTLSIDDIGERFEYQRTGANWQHVKSNIERFEANCGEHAGNNVVCHICCTLSNMNIFYLPEILEWFTENAGHMLVYLNLLHEKELFCIRNLPTRLKELIAANLNGLHFSKSNTLDSQKRSLQDIIAFMHLEPNMAFAEFLKEMARSDRYLKKDFNSVFKQYSQAIVACENL